MPESMGHAATVADASVAPVRVAFVLPSYDGGGAQRVLLTLLRHLDRSRFQPELIVFSDHGPLAGDVAPGISPICLDQPRLRNAVPALFGTLRRLRPDVIFSTMGYVNLALLAMRPLLPGRPRLVLREPNTPSSSLPSLRYGNVIAAGYRLLYPRADVILCQSALMMRELADLYGVPSRLLQHLANPVDVKRLRELLSPVEREPGQGRRFIACGSLIHQKGFDRLLPLFAGLPPEDRLTVLGTGEEEAALRAQCEQLGLSARVRFAGYVGRPWPWFAGADAVLIPSRWEGQSNVALEALTCGTPVIATPESGGIDEIAAAAPSGAVRVAAIGEAFSTEMRRVMLAAPGPRASLLPQVHDLEVVMARFQAFLA